MQIRHDDQKASPCSTIKTILDELAHNKISKNSVVSTESPTQCFATKVTAHTGDFGILIKIMYMYILNQR